MEGPDSDLDPSRITRMERMPGAFVSDAGKGDF